MATAVPKSQHRPTPSLDDSIQSSLNTLSELLTGFGNGQSDPDFFEELGREMRRLHARLRIHHAVDQIASERCAELTPELMDEINRLRGEHPDILGKLDRLVRCVDSMADRSLEDREVFLLRCLELIALLRRHEAEEDRIFYLSVWRDTGGES